MRAWFSGCLRDELVIADADGRQHRRLGAAANPKGGHTLVLFVWEGDPRLRLLQPQTIAL
jgi:hypothetical protein